ncbi:Phosphatidylinositol 3,5-bisphosphate-binding protein [Pseudogymnoascus destructans]|uniref:Phosphatidylinositol 3,5-bisphosphate-binding protein n=1 Tax=Pseudogymnoascus destructans TaxID=655981 RepID=A0A177A583_9PEZI|nr:Phosphatidylinositol 3,5-bisphosphate-binding protein [Pseudogymnoascus destructans]OAF56790.1 Phosphatidylinositol 3,5-bisphosphate-binding protein [Pseudogymnoascus destructans]
MNTRPAIEPSVSPVALYAAFNDDATCFSVGLDSGFCIFNSDPCELRVSRDFNGGVGTVDMLARANYIALVGGGKQPKFPLNKVIIWDDAKQKAVITLEFRTAVRRVRLTRQRIVVVLQNSVHVYVFSSPPEKVSISDTADNPLGLCCLSSQLLAFPGRTPGQVHLVELETGGVRIIPAHTSPLRAIEISPDGEIMATASKTARHIDTRIWNTQCQMLAVTSDKSTLHVFDMPHPSKVARPDSSNPNRRLTSMGSGSPSPVGDEAPTQKWGILSRIPMLPRVFSDIYSFASAHFELGDAVSQESSLLDSTSEASRPRKGVIGWTSDHSLIVISAGRDGRWEKFILAEGDDGKRYCVRDGWKRYLGPS